MRTRLRMKCPSCGHWNRVKVNKLFIEQPYSEPKVRVLIPMYKPLEVVKCKKCGKVIAEPKELINVQTGKPFLLRYFPNFSLSRISHSMKVLPYLSGFALTLAPK